MMFRHPLGRSTALNGESGRESRGQGERGQPPTPAGRRGLTAPRSRIARRSTVPTDSTVSEIAVLQPVRMFLLLLPALFCLVAPGQSPFTHDPLSGATTLATNIAVATESAVSPEGGAYALDDKHKLAVGDKISFQIIEDRDPAKSLTVTDSGELDVPYVGRVVALSKTCKQLAQELKVLLEKEYYYRASVVIGLDSVSKVRGRLYIWGQVRNQGPIEIPAGENLTVGKVILRAGGFADFANKKKVKLVRTNPDGKNQTFELNMVVIMEDGRTELDMAVQEDDSIIVPARLINF